MTNRSLTTLAIRFAALLIFMKIFEFFGEYLFSIFSVTVVPFFEAELHSTIDKFYYNGVFLMVSNFLVSGFLFFKAEWVASKLIRDNNEINIGLTPEKLIKSILLTTGLIWLASSVYLIPDLFDYIQLLIARHNNVEFSKKVDFSPFYYILKTTIALLFVFRVENISSFLEKKMSNVNPPNEIV
jgi:hypothetical protein